MGGSFVGWDENIIAYYGGGVNEEREKFQTTRGVTVFLRSTGLTVNR
jgi:hypothetical protein